MSRRIKSVAFLVLLLALINLPMIQASLTRRDVARSGTDVTATLVDSEVVGGADDQAYWISYRLPVDVDPSQGAWPRQVEQSAYEKAVAEGELTVRVIPGEPVTAQVPGQVVSRVGLVVTLVADLLLLGFVLVLWRFGRYGRPDTLHLEAVGDVLEGEAGDGAVDEDEDGALRVTGLLLEVTDDDVVLAVGRRRIIVALAGRRVLAPLDGPAWVEARRVG